MRVVSDTSPLNYLILIGEVSLLPRLFESVVVPPGVRAELAAPDAPAPVRRWIRRPPPWLHVHDVQDSDDTELIPLHRGEREALLLAEHVQADALLLDERIARRIASHRGLDVIGLIGILNGAAERNLIDVGRTVERLRQTSFRASPALYRWLLEQERKRTG